MPSTLRNYIYFDTPGIDSLVRQTTEYEEKERKISILTKETSSKKSATNPKLSATVLAAGFEVSGTSEDQAQRDASKEHTQVLFKPNEQKLLDLENYLNRNDELATISDAKSAFAIDETHLPAFCQLRNFSVSVSASSAQEAYESVLREQQVLMESQSPAVRGCKVFVAAGLSKFISVRYVPEKDGFHFGRTSHLAILVREMALGPVQINVFGQIRVGHGVRHVKPYAIWF